MRHVTHTLESWQLGADSQDEFSLKNSSEMCPRNWAGTEFQLIYKQARNTDMFKSHIYVHYGAF